MLLGDDIVSLAVEVDCKPKKVSMVIDDTGSMSNILGSIVSSLTSYINSQPEDEYTSWNLTTFKDSPTNHGTTDDRSQILSWVSALFASGGGDCPEDSLGGISTGLSALGTDPSTNKQMLVATDASAHGGDVDGIIASAQANGVKVNVLLAGDCSFPTAAATSLPTAATARLLTAAVTDPLSSQVVLKRIANETGGQYFFMPNGTTADYTNALNKIFTNIENSVGLPLGFTTTALPTATVGVPYSQQLAVQGGSPSYFWAVNSRRLPAGLALDGTTGQISGTPTYASSSIVTFQVNDSSSPAQTATMTLVLTASDMLTITTASLPGGTVGAAYSQTLQTTGGAAPLTWSLNLGATLPPGMSLNSATGEISGTPMAAVTNYRFAVHVTDSKTPSQTATAVLLLTITN